MDMPTYALPYAPHTHTLRTCTAYLPLPHTTAHAALLFRHTHTRTPTSHTAPHLHCLPPHRHTPHTTCTTLSPRTPRCTPYYAQQAGCGAHAAGHGAMHARRSASRHVHTPLLASRLPSHAHPHHFRRTASNLDGGWTYGHWVRRAFSWLPAHSRALRGHAVRF